MVDAVMSYLDKYQIRGSYNYKDVLATFKQIDNDYRNDDGAFKDCDDDVFNYDEFAEELYKRDKDAAKDMREFCDYESKESETTVSRKTLHVPEVAEDDKDLEY